MKQGMIHRFATHSCGLDKGFQIMKSGWLANKITQ
jgi:hypothetical protein